MKALLTFLVSLIALQSYTQNAQTFLKTTPYITAETPDWAIEMYKQNPNVLAVDALRDTYCNSHPFTKNIHTQNYRHWRVQVEPYLQADGTLVVPNSEEIIQHHLVVFEKKRQNKLTRSAGQWQPLGPFETYSADGETSVSWQANVYTIDQSKTDPNIVYVGTEAGGIFKSTDKGMSWNMVSQETAMRTISSIKVSPANPDVVYAGDATAIYRSQDGGMNWAVVFVENDLNINDLAISEANNNIILAAGRNGLYRSEDAGENWDKVLDSRIWDVEFKSDDASIVFVIRSDDQEIRQEFWKSIDSGKTFSIREAGWYSPTNAERINGGGRMAVTSADGNRIYVILVGASKPGDHGYIGVYTSYDAGDTWRLNNPPVGGPYDDDHPNLATLSNTTTLQQGYYNLGIAASDTNADILMVGCLNLWRSTDGGTSYTVLGGYQGGISWIHPDQQEIEINGNDMWVVNDGGINYSNDYFATHESRKQGLNASDFWGLGSAWNEDLIVGGRYHNGNTAHRPAFGNGNYLRLGGGEASTGYVQPGGESVAYFSDISSKVIPQNIGEAVRDVAQLSLYPNESYFASNWSELEFDPNCYGHIWLGRDNKLYKSEDNGNSFQVIREFGEADDPVHNIEISRADNDVMYVYQRTTFYGAILWVTRDGGETWEQKTFPQADSQRSGSLAIHSLNSGTLWVTFGHQRNDGNKVFRTDDYGDSWTNITESILDGERIHCSYHQAGTDHLFVGTDYGIYFHDGTQWSDCSQGLPMRLNTNRMLPFYKDNKLRVATYGNGVWEMDLPASAAPMAQATVDKRFSGCARDTFFFDDYSIVEHDASLSYTWAFSPDPQFISSSTVRNPKVVFGADGYYEVQLTVTNEKGSDVFTGPDFIEISGNECFPDGAPEKALLCLSNGDDLVQTPDMGFSSDAYTITAWVKPNGIQEDFTGILFNDSASYGFNFTYDNQLGFHHQGAESAAWAWQSGLAAPANEWSYVALVVKPEGATVYLNGEPSSISLDLEPVTLSTMKIGSYKGWQSRNYNGLIDEVTLWNRALTTTEIRQQRHLTKTTENAPELVAYYQFNEDSRVYDKIADKHGSLRGSAVLVDAYAPVGAGDAWVWEGPGMGEVTLDKEDIQFIGSVGDGTITGTKLNLAPNKLTLDDQFPSDTYWIINQNGESSLESIVVMNQSIDPAYNSAPERISMYAREDNNSDIDFSFNASATKVEELTGQFISFDVASDFSGQFVLDKQSLPSSIQDTEKEQLLVYPNPTSSDITIKSDEDLKHLTIYDIKGQQIISRSINAGERSEILEGLPNGKYTYLVELQNGELRTGKILKLD